MVPRDGFEPPQSKTTDLQSAYLTNESPGLLAQVQGFEPWRTGLEPVMLPLHHTHILRLDQFICERSSRTCTYGWPSSVGPPRAPTHDSNVLPLTVTTLTNKLINFSHKKRSCPNYTRTDENLRMLRSAPHKTTLYSSAPGDLECLHATDVTWKRIYKCQQIRY